MTCHILRFLPLRSAHRDLRTRRRPGFETVYVLVGFSPSQSRAQSRLGSYASWSWSSVSLKHQSSLPKDVPR